MRKAKISLLIIFALVFLGFRGDLFGQEAKAAEIKIGYLDLSKTFDEYGKTKEYDTVLEAKTGEYEKARNEKFDKLKALQEKLNISKEEEKAKIQADIDKLRSEFVEWDRQQQTDLRKQRDEKIREVLLEIEKVVSDYAQKEGFTFVLNDRVLIYGNKGGDITEPILKILNDNYSKAGKK